VSPTYPPRPSKRVTTALAAVALVTFLYSIVIAGQILLWFVLVGLAVGLYLTYLLIVAVFRLVEAVERIATAAEVDTGIRTAAEAGNSTPPDDRDASADPESGTPSVETDATRSVVDEDDVAPDGASPDGSAGSDIPDDSVGSDSSDDPDDSDDRPNDG
jgi:hypothetical protein